jgi:hypothetical protein
MKLFLLCEDAALKIPFLANKYKLPENQIQKLLEFDPTPNKKFLDWICKQYNKKNISPDDKDKINKQLGQFENIKNKQEFKLHHQTDINKYDPAKLYDVLSGYGQESGRHEKKVGRAGGVVLPVGSELVLDELPFKAVKITDPKASEILCSGTNWCTANARTANKYLKDGPLYLIYKDDKRICLIHYESDQFKEPNDSEVNQATKFKLVDLLSDVTGITKENDAQLAYRYASDVAKGRFPEGEAAIASNPSAAFNYAKYFVKGRWPEGEAAIAGEARESYHYAKDIINGRWPEGEAAIVDDPNIAYLYAASVIGNRWPESEKTIARSSEYSYLYAKDVIHGRFPEGEKAIARGAKQAYYYARDIIKGRFQEGEKAISKNPARSYQYAKDVIKGKWPEGEAAILKDNNRIVQYIKRVIKGRWPEGEKILNDSPFYRDQWMW